MAILDPRLCVSAPPPVTAACGMDALTQLIEAYVSTKASPLTEALAMDGMRHLIPALPDAYGKGAADPACRGAVAYGAFLSGVTLANAGLGVVHGVAGPMGGYTANASGERFIECDYWSGQMMQEFYDELQGGKGPVYLKLNHLAEEHLECE